MKRTLLCLTFFLSSLYAQEPYHTTAYLPEVLETWSLLSASQYQTDHFWNCSSKKLPTYNKFKKNTVYFYVEEGVCKNLSLFLNTAYADVEESLNGKSRGFEDCEVGGKFRLFQKNTLALTFQATGIVPAGERKSSLRYGKWGAEGGILIADLFSILERKCWYDLGLLYRSFQGFPSDQLRAQFSLGCHLCSQLYLVGTSKLEFGLWNGREGYRGNNVVLHPNYRLLKIQVDGFFSLCSYVSFTLGAFYHVWGQNCGTSGGFQGGAKFDF